MVTDTESGRGFDVWQEARELGFGEVHVKFDSDSQLEAIIAIHSTALGPALGGCRYVTYNNFPAAITDALRLAQGMSYKAAMANLNLGGGKSVIVKKEPAADRTKLFTAFGKFVDTLGGRYITAVDSGTTVADMDIIHRETRYVASTSGHEGGTGDPSPYTAYGVMQAIVAAVEHRFGSAVLTGRTIAIQGVGNVGYHLAKLLHNAGAKLIVADINDKSIERVHREFGARDVGVREILVVECDVFAPCALGGILTDEIVAGLRCPIVAGGANNQLATRTVGRQLLDKGIVYVPDYVANAGGLIQIATVDETATYKKLDAIRDTVKLILEKAGKRQLPAQEIADDLARARIAGRAHVTSGGP